MLNRIVFTLGGLFLGMISPVFMGSLIASIAGVKLRTFVWNLFHLNGFYNNYFQLGIALNIGIFFLFMRRENTMFFGRGWLIATMLMVIWTVIIEIHWAT